MQWDWDVLLDRAKFMEMYLLTRINVSQVDKWDVLSWLAMNTWKPEMPSMSVTAIEDSGELDGSHHYIEEFLSEAVYLNLVKCNDDRKYRRYRINLDDPVNQNDMNFHSLLELLWCQAYYPELITKFKHEKWNSFGDKYPDKFVNRSELMHFTFSRQWNKMTPVLQESLVQLEGLGEWRQKQRRKLQHLDSIYKTRYDTYYSILTGTQPQNPIDPALTVAEFEEFMRNDQVVQRMF
tara:strand:+ start:1501 stop:2208 length:708 start_codon:yes stop_codon:yes gene_type:complete